MQSTQLNQLIENALSAIGVNLYNLSLNSSDRGASVRVYIDKEDGVNIDDCTKANKQIRLQLSNYEQYCNLGIEVSSPGVNRTLYSIDHYKENVGKDIKIKFSNNEEVMTIIGKIISIDNEVIIVNNMELANISINFSSIIKARLHWEK